MNADLVKDYGGVSWAIYEVMENGNYRLMYEGGATGCEQWKFIGSQ